jgi:transposase
MLVVVDSARWHHARELQPSLREHRHVLQRDFLPPYSPDLSPVEWVWKLTRYLCTRNRYFAALEELVTAVWSQFTF